jgi:hypothetical protein
LALLAMLAAGPAAADPALVFSGADWRLPIEPSDVHGFQVLPAPGGRLSLAIALKADAAQALAERTGRDPGETVTLADGLGTVLLEGPLDGAIERGVFAVTFASGEDALRMVRRLQGQP